MNHSTKAPLLLTAALVGLVTLAACDAPSVPIPPTPTPGAFKQVAGGSHSHGDSGSNTPLFTRYGGDVAVDFTTDPPQPQPNTTTQLLYKLTGKDGAALTLDRLVVTHEKPMHLIMVNRDLSYFSHVHPEHLGDGRYAVTADLPESGPFILFNEFYTSDGKSQIERDVLAFGGSVQDGPSPTLPDTLGKAQQADGLTAELTASTRKIARRSSTAFQMTVTQNGKLATDLEPFLGAPAHVVIVSADTKQFAHTHADLPGGAMSRDMTGMDMSQMEMPTPPAKFGPELLFAHTFMQPGPYRIWVQVGHAGKVVNFSFNVQVYK